MDDLCAPKAASRSMLSCDPIPWLMEERGPAAVRARRLLGLRCDGDEKAVKALERELGAAQRRDGSFDKSPMKTAGVLNLLDDLRAADSDDLIASGASYLVSVLESQPGYRLAENVGPGTLTTACDLCGFFGPDEARWEPDLLAHNAREMNFYMEYEPLLGPKSPVRGVRRSTLDRPGPSSCYTWGLIPLSYAIEALCRAGYSDDQRLQPAVNALLGTQRESGGWCRNLGGATACTIHAARASGSHPKLKDSKHAKKMLEFMRATQTGDAGDKAMRWWRGSNLFAAIQAVAAFDLPIARNIVRDGLSAAAALQRKNGTFGSPCRVERVAAALVGTTAVGPGAG